MTSRPRLLSNAPFWVLVAGSVASAGAGIWLTLDKLDTMTTTLAAGSATGVEVYAGQAWVVVGAVLIGAGLVGLALALTLAAAASLVKPEEPTLVSPDEDADDQDDVPHVVVTDQARTDSTDAHDSSDETPFPVGR